MGLAGHGSTPCVFHPPPRNSGQTCTHSSYMGGSGAGEQAQPDRLSFKPLLTSHGAKHTTWLSSVSKGRKYMSSLDGGELKSHMTKAVHIGKGEELRPLKCPPCHVRVYPSWCQSGLQVHHQASYIRGHSKEKPADHMKKLESQSSSISFRTHSK